MRNFKMPQDYYVPKGQPVEKREFPGGVAYLTEVHGPGPLRHVLVVFLGKQSKPAIRCGYKTAEAREMALTHQIEACARSAEYKAKLRADRKPNNAGIAVGDIFVASGGYEQTNVEAQQVVELVGSSSVKVRTIACGAVESKPGYSSMADHVKPVKDAFLDGAGVRKVIGGAIKGTWGNASKWDGQRDFYRSWYA